MTPEQARQQAESLASNFQILSGAVFNLSEHAMGVADSIECDGEVTEYEAERLQRLTRQFEEIQRVIRGRA